MMERAGECRLVCTCDPGAQTRGDASARWGLARRGVAVHGDYRGMLEGHAHELDAVIIPTPIPLHAEMHAAVVGRGLAAYLEKPPTLDPAELERMIALDEVARVPTLVGFNFIPEPERQVLKRRLAAGEFGVLKEARLIGLWARSSRYYGRNSWAGALFSGDGRLLLDSCLGNGLSHHVHNLLHWAGSDGVDRWAEPTGVRAMLARAHSIEGADTAFVAAETSTGVRLRIALSHACHGPEFHRETLECEHAVIDYVTNERMVIRWRDGRVEMTPLAGFDAQVANLRHLFACIRGERARPPTTLADSRPFVALNAMAYLSSGRIHVFPEGEILPTGRGGVTEGYRSVRGLPELAARFLADGSWPAGEPREVRPTELGRLSAVVREMSASMARPEPGRNPDAPGIIKNEDLLQPASHPLVSTREIHIPAS